MCLRLGILALQHTHLNFIAKALIPSELGAERPIGLSGICSDSEDAMLARGKVNECYILVTAAAALLPCTRISCSTTRDDCLCKPSWAALFSGFLLWAFFDTPTPTRSPHSLSSHLLNLPPMAAKVVYGIGKACYPFTQFWCDM